MTKQTKRKGFTAVEMLIVIAVIAVLVSVVVPVVNGNNIRAKAAANAANLRAIEGLVSMELLQSPEDFDEFLKKGEELSSTSEGILGKLYDLMFGDGAAEESRNKYNSLVDNGERQIVIPRSGKIIPNVAVAKGMEAPHRNGGIGLDIDDGAIMHVYITDEGALASYGDYTKDDFADVAEDGYYDGMVTSSGGNGGGGGLKDFIDSIGCKSTLLEGKHTPGANCLCIYCGTEAHKDADRTVSGIGIIEYKTSTSVHACRCGKVFNGDHKYEGSDHACKYNDCDKVTTCIDRNPESWRDEADHKCYLCNAHMPDECVGHDNRPANHYCDVCGEWVKGSVCGVDTDNNFSCDVCGKALEHECYDGTDNKHICDVPGCNKTVADAEHTRGGGGWLEQDKHHCSQCGAEIDKCSDKTGDGNHKCDICGDNMGSCSDSAGDGDHTCDECGGKVSSSKCSDAANDGNHDCDECGASCGSCTSGSDNGNGTHKCPECKNDSPHTGDSGGCDSKKTCSVCKANY